MELQSPEIFQALDPVGYMKEFQTSNTRPDGRTRMAARPTTILPAILPRNTHGSSMVSLGNTRIVVSATLSIGIPPVHAPQMGEMDVSLHFSPLCGGSYDERGRWTVLNGGTGGGTGGPGRCPVTLSSMSMGDPWIMESQVRRIVRHAFLLEQGQLQSQSQSQQGQSQSQLCVEEGKACWKIHLSCVVLNHDGNLMDASILGCFMALKDLRLPYTQTVGCNGSTNSNNNGGGVIVKTLSNYADEEEYEKEQELIACDNDHDNNDSKSMELEHDNNNNNATNNNTTTVKAWHKKGKALKMHTIPIPMTVSLFNGKMYVDPTLEEENVCDGSITVVIDASTVLVNDDLTTPTANANSSSTIPPNPTILNVQKMGTATVTKEDMTACIRMAIGRAREMKSILT